MLNLSPKDCAGTKVAPDQLWSLIWIATIVWSGLDFCSCLIRFLHCINVMSPQQKQPLLTYIFVLLPLVKVIKLKKENKQKRKENILLGGYSKSFIRHNIRLRWKRIYLHCCIIKTILYMNPHIIWNWCKPLGTKKTKTIGEHFSQLVPLSRLFVCFLLIKCHGFHSPKLRSSVTEELYVVESGQNYHLKAKYGQHVVTGWRQHKNSPSPATFISYRKWQGSKKININIFIRTNFSMYYLFD